MGEDNLVGSLQRLVTTVLAAGTSERRLIAMIRRRSTVRFRKGAPGQRAIVSFSNGLVGTVVGTIGSPC
jgi:hypothetical protein